MDNKPPGDFGRLSIRVTMALLLAGLALAFILLFWCLPQYREEIKFSAAALGGAAAVYTAYFATASLRFSVRLARDKNSFDLLRDLNQINITKIRAAIDAKIPAEPPSPSELVKLITDDTKLMEDVHLFLGLFEDTSIAVKNDHVNEKILYDSLSFLVPHAYRRLRPYIEHLRDKDDDKSIFIELQRLASVWDEGKSLKTGASLKD